MSEVERIREVIRRNPTASLPALRVLLYHEGVDTWEARIRLIRGELAREEGTLPRLVQGKAQKKGVSDKVRQAILGNKGMNQREIQILLAKDRIAASDSLISKVYQRLIKEGAIVSHGPHTSLSSPIAAARKALYYQGDKTTRQIAKELSGSGINYSVERLNSLRNQMRVDGINLPRPSNIPTRPLKPLPKLSPEQEKVRKEMMPHVRRSVDYNSKKLLLSEEDREDFALQAEILAHKLAARFDPKRRNKLSTYVIGSTNKLALEFKRNQLKQRLGLNNKESRALFALLGASNRGEPIQPIIERHGITPEKAEELLELHRAHFPHPSLDELGEERILLRRRK